MYAELNACMRKRLGACMRNLGACMRKRLGAKYAVVGCKVYGDVWVQSICLLGASLIRLIACLTVGSYTLHVYPLAWAQGPPGAPGPNNQNNQSINQTIKQSINQTINQTIEQSNNQTNNQTTKQYNFVCNYV